MAQSKNGYVKISRRIPDWEWWDDARMVKLWVYIIVNANWTGGSFKGVYVPRGSFITTYRNLAAAVGVSVNTLKNELRKLQKTGEISLKSDTHFTVIKVHNYAVFQDSNSEIGTKSDTQVDTHSDTHFDTDIRIKNKEKRNIYRGTEISGFQPPSLDEIISFCKSENLSISPQRFFSYYNARGWRSGKALLTDWKSKAREWEQNEIKRASARIAVLPEYMTHEQEELKEASPEECEAIKKQLEEHKKKEKEVKDG